MTFGETQGEQLKTNTIKLEDIQKLTFQSATRFTFEGLNEKLLENHRKVSVLIQLKGLGELDFDPEQHLLGPVTLEKLTIEDAEGNEQSIIKISVDDKEGWVIPGNSIIYGNIPENLFDYIINFQETRESDEKGRIMSDISPKKHCSMTITPLYN